ncbi:MAG: hypothetical protein IKE24_11280 [Clostridia bacterium]|nr:hypothetical protein [Clostridia bacterium]
MSNFEALWTFQTEDIKADTIANEIRRSPTRQKLERSRDFILERQKQYKQIEDSISGLADRKEMLEQALARAVDRLDQLRGRMNGLDPEDEASVEAMVREMSDAREELHSFEAELSHMNSDAGAYDKQLRSVRVEAAKAKQAFDQLKVDYENESKTKKEELEAQRARAKALESSVEPDLLAEYMAIKKHITPPVSRLQFGQCSGCNTSLPSATLSKIRNGVLVECETCGRMIIQ